MDCIAAVFGLRNTWCFWGVCCSRNTNTFETRRRAMDEIKWLGHWKAALLPCFAIVIGLICIFVAVNEFQVRVMGFCLQAVGLLSALTGADGIRKKLSEPTVWKAFSTAVLDILNKPTAIHAEMDCILPPIGVEMHGSVRASNNDKLATEDDKIAYILSIIDSNHKMMISLYDDLKSRDSAVDDKIEDLGNQFNSEMNRQEEFVREVLSSGYFVAVAGFGCAIVGSALSAFPDSVIKILQ